MSKEVPKQFAITADTLALLSDDPVRVPTLRIDIPAGDRLDPITVYCEELGGGRGRCTITCYGQAWTCCWPGMGTDSIYGFMLGINEHYFVGCLEQGRRIKGRTKAERASEDEYLTRIARRVLSVIKEAKA